MLKRLLSLGAAALAVLTAGCGDGPATVAGTWRSPAAWSSMVYATNKGPMLVEVHGSPFGEAGPDFRAAVAAAMTNKVFGRRAAFTADPEQAPQPRYRVVLAFNPPPDTDARALCVGHVATATTSGATTSGATTSGERITVQGAFCDGTTLLASIQGWVAKVSGREDPRFLLLIEQITRELFGSPP